MSIPANVPALQAPQWVANYAMGPQQIGYTCQFILLGMFAVLFVEYAMSGELARHRALGKIALWSSLALNICYTGLCVYESYVAAVSQNRTSDELISSNTAWQFLPLLAGLVGVVTQGFLTTHALVLIPRKILRPIFSGVMGILIAAQITGFTAATINGVFYVQGKNEVDVLGYNNSLSLWLWASGAADILISLVCACSIRQRLFGYTRETDTVIIKLVVICFRTAAYTTLMSTVGAILASVFHHDFDLRSFTSFAFWTCQPGLYGLALFTFSRSSRRVVSTPAHLSTHTTPIILERKAHFKQEPRQVFLSAAATRSTEGGSAPKPLAIRVDCERVITIDEPSSDYDSSGATGSLADTSRSGTGRANASSQGLNKTQHSFEPDDVLDFV
ncbi:hypothetical protein JCM10908_005286 [Rhodotorula pacifica]|uniref:uncharacterized protein n=1 Tax=Rhodotorula pacifica TaxID=1495444 RepID=UPI003170E7F2